MPFRLDALPPHIIASAFAFACPLGLRLVEEVTLRPVDWCELSDAQLWLRQCSCLSRNLHAALEVMADRSVGACAFSPLSLMPQS